jgi:hypothetical protein
LPDREVRDIAALERALVNSKHANHHRQGCCRKPRSGSGFPRAAPEEPSRLA